MIRPIDEMMMQRCYHIARRSGSDAGGNPMVGAVITYEDRIIGEGRYERYGGPHAEPNAIASVASHNLHLLKKAHIYVSLEPCNFYGKTPPCTNAILNADIPKVTIGTTDPSDEMSGKSIDILRSQGIEVLLMPKSRSASNLIAPFTATKIHNRPFTILKYAISKDGFIGHIDKPIWLSNAFAKKAVHQLRSELDGIMVGTNTAIADNPSLTTREVPGNHPKRILVDRKGRVPSTHKLRSDEFPSIIVTSNRDYQSDALRSLIILEDAEWNLCRILSELKENGIHTLMVEGGSELLKSFIAEGLWDQCHLYKTPIVLREGIKAPSLKGQLLRSIQIGDNKQLIINRL